MALISHKEKIRSLPFTDVVESCIYLKIKSESASSGPPIGPTLGQYGIPAAQFCKDFNERTTIFKKNVELRVIIYLYKSGIYTFEITFPTASFFFKKVLRRSYASGKPGQILSRRKERIDSLEDVRPINRTHCWTSKFYYRVITMYMVYEVMKYKYRYELFQLSDFSIYTQGIGIIRSLGMHILDHAFRHACSNEARNQPILQTRKRIRYTRRPRR